MCLNGGVKEVAWLTETGMRTLIATLEMHGSALCAARILSPAVFVGLGGGPCFSGAARV